MSATGAPASLRQQRRPEAAAANTRPTDSGGPTHGAAAEADGHQPPRRPAEGDDGDDGDRRAEEPGPGPLHLPAAGVRRGDRAFRDGGSRGGLGIDPSTTAVLWIEFQNEFATPGGVIFY